MKAVVQTYRSGKLSLLQSPAPELRPGGVLVATRCSVLSAGTERAKVELAKKSLLGKAKARPEAVRQVLRSLRQSGLRETLQKVNAKLDQYSPLGYSSAGIALAVGAGVEHLQPGQAVACAGAGFANHAEIAFVPQNLCAAIPDGVPFDAAAFTTLGAIALQGVRQAETGLRDRVLVVGLGLLGLIAVQLLRAAGCMVVGIDMDESRVQLALRLGAERAFPRQLPDLESVLRGVAPRGFDAAILTAAAPTNDPVRLAAEMLRDRGRVVVVGNVQMSLPRPPFYEKELELRLSRSYGPGRYDPHYEEQGVDYPYGYVRWTEQRNMQAFLESVARGLVNVSRLITHRFPFERAEEAYRVLNGQAGEPFIAIVLDYPPLVVPPAAAQIKPQAAGGTTAARPVPDSVRVGVIGAGSFARGTLLPALGKRGHIEAVATATGLSAASLADMAGARSTSVDEVLSDPAVNLVMIATHHSNHAELAVRALENGKAVFVEKPLATSESQLSALADVYDSLEREGKNPFLMVGFNRRFSPLVGEMRKALANRTEPAMLVYRVNAGYIPREHWTQGPEGAGRVIGEVCHFVDLAEYLLGSRIREVSASALPNNERYRDDNVTVTARLEDGSLAMIVYAACGDKSTGKERVEVFCQGTCLLLDDFRRLIVSKQGRAKTIKSTGKGHVEEMRALVDALLAGKPSPVSFEDSVRVTLATFAILHELQGVAGDEPEVL